MTVYFLRDERNLIKIGTTERDVQARLKEVQLGASGLLKIDLEIPGGRDVERAVHDVLRRFRVRGEWFQNPPLDNSLTRRPPDPDVWDRFLEWGRHGYHLVGCLVYEHDAAEQLREAGGEICGDIGPNRSGAMGLLFDHPSYWSRGGEDVHVYQPYIGRFQDGGLTKAAAVAKSLGMDVFVSPALSWWNPGQNRDGLGNTGATVLTAYAKPGVLHDFLIGI